MPRTAETLAIRAADKHGVRARKHLVKMREQLALLGKSQWVNAQEDGVMSLDSLDATLIRLSNEGKLPPGGQS